MRHPLRLALLSAGSLTMIGMSPVGDSPTLANCVNGRCTMRMTAPQLLREAERLVLAGRYAEARPLLDALIHAPELSMQRHFLNGYVAAETGDFRTAEGEFRAVLRDRPDIVRARLELARVLMLQGKDSAADHHFRLAEDAKDLPPEIERTIRDSRAIIRGRKNWYFNLDFGLAPDSNINSATSATTLDTIYGPNTVQLDPSGQRKSGLGQTIGAQAGVRLRLKDGLAMAIDADGQVINQPGSDYDDISALIAAGPELTMKNGARLSLQALAVGRWYGGTAAQKGGGARLSYQRDLSGGQRITGRLESRRYESDFSEAYGGWSHAGSLTYEQIVNARMIASGTLFARREDLRSEIYSSTEFGYSVGIGGELGKGINAGLSASISRALFDAENGFWPDKRKDWRFSSRAYLGLRSIRVLGFSPAITYTYSRNKSNLGLYDTSRHRAQFELARYF